MPLERPRRNPVVRDDGANDPVWLRYFDNLDLSTSTTESFEVESRFLAGSDPSPLQGSVKRVRAVQRERELQPESGLVDPRVKRLAAQIRELRFLEA